MSEALGDALWVVMCVIGIILGGLYAAAISWGAVKTVLVLRNWYFDRKSEADERVE